MKYTNSKSFTDEFYLLERLSQTDKMAFEYVFHKFYPKMCLYASNILNNEEQSQDIAKEAFIKIWKSNKKFNSLEHLKNSLYQSTRQVALNYLTALERSTKREEQYSSNLQQFEDSHLHHIIYTEVMSELYAAIHQLPEQAKKIIILTYLEGKSNQEAADELQISLQTAKNYKIRAIKQLRGLLKPQSILLILSTIEILEKISIE